MRDWAERLLVYEASQAASEPSDAITPPPFSVAEKLRPHFSTLMGSIGFRALLSRALSLAAAEVPWLRAVHVKADSSFEGLDASGAQLDQEEIAEGGVVLIAQLLGLLVAFIGENLTLRLVGGVWPDLALDDTDLGAGVNNEKAQ
jgi:hypothetical protein